MEYLSAKDFASQWGLSERTIRNYCSSGKIAGAILDGKTWRIPADAKMPKRSNKKATNELLLRLREEKDAKVSGGIYHEVQIDLTYNSNHIEGSRLTHDQTRFIFETNTIGVEDTAVKVDDIIETSNHFRAIDYVIDNANRQLSEVFIKELHKILKTGTSDSRLSWFNVGEYKMLANQIGGNETTKPCDVASDMARLLSEYNRSTSKTLEELVAFHYEFESIHPFQDGNGRVGRLILFKECLKNNIVPFVINEELKFYYYRGLREWTRERGYLIDTMLTAQDAFKRMLDYFEIDY